MTNRKIIGIGIAAIILFISLGVWLCIMLLSTPADFVPTITSANSETTVSTVDSSQSASSKAVSSRTSSREPIDVKLLVDTMNYKPSFPKTKLTEQPTFLGTKWGMTIEDALSALGYTNNADNVIISDDDTENTLTSMTAFIENASLYGTTADILLSFAGKDDPLATGLQSVMISTIDDTAMKSISSAFDKLFDKNYDRSPQRYDWTTKADVSEYYDYEMWQKLVVALADTVATKGDPMSGRSFERLCADTAAKPIVSAQRRTVDIANADYTEYRFTMNGKNASTAIAMAEKD